MKENFNFIAWDNDHFDVKGPIQPATYVRKEFQVSNGFKKAKLYMTSLGNYIPFINGQKPDDQWLTPGYTEYSKRLQYQVYDITPFVQAGINAIGAIVGDGWYRGSCGPMSMRATYGSQLALAAAIELIYEDCSEYIPTDCSWKWTNDGPIRKQDIKLIEHYDARMEIEGWSSPGFDDTLWNACTDSEHAGEIVASQGEPVHSHEHFTPEILHTPDGAVVLDFGQNIAGYVKFTVTGTAGDTIRMIHGEVLDQHGNFTVKNLGDSNFLKLGQELVYDLKNGTQTYEPQFLICGFRYVKLSDWPEEVNPYNFEAHAVYSDLITTGEFECSNPKINRLVENTLWSLKSNFVDIPTDCPQRERAGWTGDINVFIECANLLADTRRFISKWLKDLILTQRDDGAILSIVPTVYMMSRKSKETTPGAAGWADAVTQIPMWQYLAYGDPADLEMCYAAMKRFVNFNILRAKKHRLLHKLNLKPDSRYILDTGFHYGEWLEPGAANLLDGLKALIAPDSEVATAWFYYSAKTLAETASILGMEEDADTYRELSESIKSAYCSHFIPNNTLSSNRQCKYVRPLYMGLVDGALKAKLAAQLNDLFIQNNYRIGTGFLSTYQVLNVLSDNGYVETAYKVLENEQCPGWLYEVNTGATTVWEGWDAIDPKTGKVKAKSLNHYSPGAAISWLWTRCCGIRSTAPGYTKIEIAPYPGGTLTYAKASYMSISGKIVSSWKKEGGKFILDVEIPEAVDATVILPDGTIIPKAVTGTYVCVIKRKES
ncbi:MAG: family 78 glycoside hydrolase catalytic domain [Clostridia bacterium]